MGAGSAWAERSAIIPTLGLGTRTRQALNRRIPVIPHEPLIIPRSEHNISRANISENALKVLYRLKNAGYAAYLVGGGVRDLLLGRHPKDFDVATDARPEEIRKLFRNCRLIGRRFRLAHVRFGREIIEVATFRAPHDAGEGGEGEGALRDDGMIVADNVYGTLESDAWRRDFTINALYYNIADFSVVDYTGGMADLREGVLRVIGDPRVRFQEDPVRMLRAIRFAAKLEFHIPEDLSRVIHEMADRLALVPAARLFDEVLKLFLSGHAHLTFELLRQHGLFGQLFPATQHYLEANEPFTLPFIRQALINTDQRIAAGKPVTPAFLFATLLWTPVRVAAAGLREQGVSPIQSLQMAGETVVREQQQTVTLPRRFQTPMREIWTSQARLVEHRAGKRPLAFVEHPRFRAAYDFLLLRCDAGEVEPEYCQWWTEFQAADEEVRQAMCEALAPARKGRRRRRRRRPRSGNAAGRRTGQ